MVSSSLSPRLGQSYGAVTVADRLKHLPQPQIKFRRIEFTGNAKSVSSSNVTLHKTFVPIAASIAILFFPNPAKAGFLSGFSGIESVPGPQLPSIEFLNRFNEENQKKYAEFDARFKESPLLKKLLEKSKLNKEKNKQEILDKYCIRGAEWGVGDCSAEGMTPDERENFIAMLKRKAGVE
ncbi:hypothetical protein NMG60_11036155 [Bertholletia excelsa]